MIRYDAALSLFPRTYESLLDVGCGTGRFKLWWNGQGRYTGIDLLAGTNVLDYREPHDVVMALGILYRVPPVAQEQLIRHMWTLASKALIVQTLSEWGEIQEPGEYPADPVDLLRFGAELTHCVQMRTDYLPHDVTLALYR